MSTLEPWWRTLAKLLWWVFSRPWAAFMALGLPLYAAYGLTQPFPGDLEALRLERNTVALLVGSGGDHDKGTGQRTYAVLPHAVVSGELTFVRDGDPVRIESSPSGFFFLLLAVWIACVSLAWKFCWLPMRGAIRRAKA